MKGTVFLAAAIGALATACGPTRATQEPIRWQLVEKRYGDLSEGAKAGDGRVDPDATVLVFQPLYRENISTEIFVSAYPDAIELVTLSHHQASVDEEVTATLRLTHPDPDGLYQVRARGSEACVRILSKNPIPVRGRKLCRFTFTSSHPGRAGLEISVERLD